MVLHLSPCFATYCFTSRYAENKLTPRRSAVVQWARGDYGYIHSPQAAIGPPQQYNICTFFTYKLMQFLG